MARPEEVTDQRGARELVWTQPIHRGQLKKKYGMSRAKPKNPHPTKAFLVSDSWENGWKMVQSIPFLGGILDGGWGSTNLRDGKLL